jgi:hypothetical protein
MSSPRRFLATTRLRRSYHFFSITPSLSFLLCAQRQLQPVRIEQSTMKRKMRMM